MKTSNIIQYTRFRRNVTVLDEEFIYELKKILRPRRKAEILDANFVDLLNLLLNKSSNNVVIKNGR